MMLTGSVARLLSGASIAPRMPPVAVTTVALPPASAWPTASTRALRLARRLPAAASNGASATADIRSPLGAKRGRIDRVPRPSQQDYCARRGSEMTERGPFEGERPLVRSDELRCSIARFDAADLGHRD